MSARRLAAAAALLVVGACAGVLGLGGRRPQPFEHRAHVVRGISCLRCHPGVEAAGDDGPLHLPGDGSCRDCHARPHDERPCLGCHSAPWLAGAASEARVHLRFSHAGHAAAVNGNCMRCHVDVRGSDGPLRPRMATCLGCHAHSRQFEPRTCDACHVDLEAEVTLPESHVVHDGEWLREHGVRAAADADLCATCHDQRSCAGCHGVTAPALPSRRAFDDPTAASVHRAGFRARHREESAAAPGTCSACHDDASCRDCHLRAGVSAGVDGAATPHPPGWIGVGPGDNEHGRAARRDPASCAGCHGGAGEQLCVGCHQVGGIGGSPHPPGWSSDRPRTELPCRMCHPR